MKKLLSLLLIPTFSFAEIDTAETWHCTEVYGTEILVIATIAKNRKTGEIKVAGVKHSSKFEVTGFNRRWNFSLNDASTYDYSFIIKPNGDALYFDFTNTKPDEVVKASIFMSCKMTREYKK